MNDSAEQQILEHTWKRSRLVSLLMLLAPVLYVVIGLVLMKSRRRPHLVHLEREMQDIIFFVFIAASVLDFLLVTALRRALLASGHIARHFNSMGRAAQHYGQVCLLTSAMCQTPALLGLVYLLLTGDLRRMVYLAGAAVVFALIHMPSRKTLTQVIRQAGAR